MSRLKVFLWALSFICYFSIQICASDAYQVTEIGTSASTIGLAQIEGFDHSSQGIFENPAILSTTKTFSISGFQTSLFENQLKYQCFSSALNTSIGTFGIGYCQASDPTIYHTALHDDGTTYVDSTFEYKTAQAKLGYSSKLSNFYWGLAASYSFQNLFDTHSTALNADAGVFIDNPELPISVSAKNILFFLPVSYSNGTTEKPPTLLTISASKPFGPLSVFGQLKQNLQTGWLKSVALRYNLLNLNTLYLSGGWHEYAANTDIHSGIALGLGLRAGSLGLDFAYSPGEYQLQTEQYYFSAFINY